MAVTEPGCPLLSVQAIAPELKALWTEGPYNSKSFGPGPLLNSLWIGKHAFPCCAAGRICSLHLLKLQSCSSLLSTLQQQRLHDSYGKRGESLIFLSSRLLLGAAPVLLAFSAILVSQASSKSFKDLSSARPSSWFQTAYAASHAGQLVPLGGWRLLLSWGLQACLRPSAR